MNSNEQNSMLQQIRKQRVFTAFVTNDSQGRDRLQVTEACDDYFSIFLTKHQAEIMIAELTQLVSEMKDD